MTAVTKPVAVGGRGLAARLGSQRVSRVFDLMTAVAMLGLGTALALAELR